MRPVPDTCEVVLFHKDFARHSGFYGMRVRAKRAGVPLVVVGSDWSKAQKNLSVLGLPAPAPRALVTTTPIEEAETLRPTPTPRPIPTDEDSVVNDLIVDRIRSRPEDPDEVVASDISACAGRMIDRSTVLSIRARLVRAWVAASGIGAAASARREIGDIKRAWLRRVFQADIAAGRPLTSQSALRADSEVIFGTGVGSMLVTEIRREFLNPPRVVVLESPRTPEEPQPEPQPRQVPVARDDIGAALRLVSDLIGTLDVPVTLAREGARVSVSLEHPEVDRVFVQVVTTFLDGGITVAKGPRADDRILTTDDLVVRIRKG